ncbi:MAG: hypothetical protein K8E24_006030 [Methanobacterium paludis]|nr:hypothetical protein [Methanobacterium paludis]
MNPRIESFKKENYSTDFHKHLQEIDIVKEYNTKMRKPKETAKNQLKSSKYPGSVEDHRVFFKSILGDPEKEYVMYNFFFQTMRILNLLLGFTKLDTIVMAVRRRVIIGSSLGIIMVITRKRLGNKE